MPVNTINIIGDQMMMAKVGSLSIEGDFYDDQITIISNHGEVFEDNANLKSATLPQFTGSSAAFLFAKSGIEMADMPLLNPVPGDCFSGCTHLTDVNFPSAVYAGNNAFRNCAIKKIDSSNFPVLRYVTGQHNFEGNEALTDVDLPSFVSDGNSTNGYYMFSHCTSLKNVNLPNMTTLKFYMFENCTSLENLYLPSINCTFGSNWAGSLKGCTSLRRVFFPSQTGAFGFDGTNRTFSGDNALEIVRVPLITSFIGNGDIFSSATGMKLLDLGSVGSIPVYVENSVVRYTKILILRKSDAITTIANSAAFNATTTPTPIKVYVPSALISSYEEGTNWSTLLANNYVEFLALEGSRFEDPDFDDTDIYNADRDNLDELL